MSRLILLLILVITRPLDISFLPRAERAITDFRWDRKEVIKMTAMQLIKKLAMLGSKVLAAIETVMKIIEFVEKIRSLLQRYIYSPRYSGLLYYDPIVR